MSGALLQARNVDGTLLVFDATQGRFLAGVGANYYRPWLFPLYTPRGQIVLREFPATKFGGIGVRLDPRLATGAGGCIIADDGRRGKADIAHGRPARYIACEGPVDGSARFGLCLIAPERAVPWFVRDYGLVLFNPTWYQGIDLAEGESWEIRLRLVAYDGALDEGRVEGWLTR